MLILLRQKGGGEGGITASVTFPAPKNIFTETLSSTQKKYNALWRPPQRTGRGRIYIYYVNMRRRKKILIPSVLPSAWILFFDLQPPVLG